MRRNAYRHPIDLLDMLFCHHSLGSSLCVHLSFPHQNEVVTVLRGHSEIMEDGNDRQGTHLILRKGADETKHAHSVSNVEMCRSFIEEQQLWLYTERLGYGSHLLLSTRQLRHIPISQGL